jgi:hypothetical protein
LGIVVYGCTRAWRPNIASPIDSGLPCEQVNPATGETVPIACGKLVLCGYLARSVCACNATGCTSQPAEGFAEFEGQFTAGEAKGTIRLPDTPQSFNVHLTKTD